MDWPYCRPWRRKVHSLRPSWQCQTSLWRAHSPRFVFFSRKGPSVAQVYSRHWACESQGEVSVVYCRRPRARLGPVGRRWWQHRPGRWRLPRCPSRSDPSWRWRRRRRRGWRASGAVWTVGWPHWPASNRPRSRQIRCRGARFPATPSLSGTNARDARSGRASREAATGDFCRSEDRHGPQTTMQSPLPAVAEEGVAPALKREKQIHMSVMRKGKKIIAKNIARY